MTIIDPQTQEATHLSTEDIPFVELGGGNKLRVLQVKEQEIMTV